MSHSVCHNIENVRAVCSGYSFQDNMLCMNVSGAPSHWNADLVLLLRIFSAEQSLQAELVHIINISFTQTYLCALGRHDSNNTLPLLKKHAFTDLVLFIILLFVGLLSFFPLPFKTHWDTKNKYTDKSNTINVMKIPLYFKSCFYWRLTYE